MIIESAQNILKQARFHAEHKHYREAFYSYIKALQLDPRDKDDVEYEFRAALTKYNCHLANADRGQMYHNFYLAMQVYPGNAQILAGIGKYLLKNALRIEALCHFEKALLIDCNLVDTEKSFDATKRFMFSRNTFRYLNDENRKQAYLSTLRSINQNKNSSEQPPNNVNNASNEKLAKVSDRIMGRSRIYEMLTINRNNGQLEIKDLLEDNSLFVMNRFGPGLFKEHLLETIQKSFEAKILDGRRVIPGSAEYYMVGVKCDRINSRFQLSRDAKEFLGIPDYIVHIHHSIESFHGKDLQTYHDLEYVTDHQKVFEIDFNNYEEVKKMRKSTAPHTAFIKSNKDVEINALVGWFNLHLTEDVTLTTDPRAPDCTDSWPQAVFFDFVPRPVKKNETISVQFLTTEGNLKLLSDTRFPITRLSSSTIAFLNDSVYLSAIVRSLGLATVHLSQMSDLSEINIADTCPFPIFGMLMLKRGADSLVCYARNQYDKEFIELVFRANNIPLSKVTILTTTDWKVFDKPFHAIVYNALDLSGDIDSRLAQIMYHLRYSYLVDGGLTYPANVKLMGQLINSARLDTLNKVKDEGSMTPLGPEVNMFASSQAHCLDLFRLEHEKLSDPVLIASSCHHMDPHTITVPVERDGVCNAIVCWYEILFTEEDEIISTYRKDSFIDVTAFLVKRPVQVHRGDTVSVIRCVDYNGSFKLAIDADVL